jgi:acetylornithine deacetylase/succinyl-diaminopimelate desuccinylase-like protein
VEDIHRFIEDHRADFVQQLVELCSQPSVSAHQHGLDQMAELLTRTMRRQNITARTVPTATGVPAVVGELRSPAAKRTLLFYNHYDVQPPDPLDEWETPPFEPSVRGGRIFARGATDNKGNIVSRLAAVRAFCEVRGAPPVNVRFLVEGQEEVMSPGLPDFVASHAAALRADACIWEDTMGRVDAPVVSLGSKGMCYLKLQCKVADTASHSAYARLYPNAAWSLVWALASLKGPDETILVEGFYDDLRELDADERRMIEALPPLDLEDRQRERGVRSMLAGVSSDNAHARQSLDPTLNISGIGGGYQGPRSKTVIPHSATAWLDIRLVPDQDPGKIADLVRAHLAHRGFADIEIECLGASLPSRSSLDNRLNRAIGRASQSVYGKPPVFEPHQAGSTPQWVVGRFLRIPCSATGVGYVTSMTHAPNENIRIDHLVDGAKYMASIMQEFAGEP